MIRLDYFDEAVGVTEGFTILEDLLGCGKTTDFLPCFFYSRTPIDALRLQIMGYDIAALLECKLGTGNPGEMRTSLIYLNIFRICMSGIFLSNVPSPNRFRWRAFVDSEFGGAGDVTPEDEPVEVSKTRCRYPVFPGPDMYVTFPSREHL